jgi:hypothetical protein
MNQNIAKGLLIILVIFDHNEYAHRLLPEFLSGFTFHVLGFFSLPFLRQAEMLNLAAIKRMFYSYLFPYIWMVCGLALITSTLQHTFTIAAVTRTLHAIYSGDALTLKAATQMSLLWFLPSFFSLMFLRGLFTVISERARYIIFFAIFSLHFWLGFVPAEYRAYFPLGILAALYSLPNIALVVFLNESLLKKLNPSLALILIIVSFTLIKWVQIRWGLYQELGFLELASFRNPLDLLVNDAEAILGALLVFQLARFSLGEWIALCGKFSLQIYLFHAFFAFAIYKLSLAFMHTDTMSLLVLSIALTVTLTTLSVQYVFKYPTIRRICFPKSFDELRSPIRTGSSL